MVNNLFENIIIKKDLFFKSIRKKKNSIAVSSESSPPFWAH